MRNGSNVIIKENKAISSAFLAPFFAKILLQINVNPIAETNIIAKNRD